MLNSFYLVDMDYQQKKLNASFINQHIGKLFLNQCNPILLNKYTTSTSMLSLKILQHEWKLLTSIHFHEFFGEA